MESMNHTLNHNAAPFTPQKYRLSLGSGIDLVDGAPNTHLSNGSSRLGDATNDVSSDLRASSGNMSQLRGILDWELPTSLGPLSPLDLQLGTSLNDIATGAGSGSSAEPILTPDSYGFGVDSLDALGMPPLQLLSMNTNGAGLNGGLSCPAGQRLSRRNGLSTSSNGNGQAANNENSPTNLIINYLPQSLTRADMQMRFETIGPLRSCKLVYGQTPHSGDSENGLVSMCYGFVDYVNPLDAIQSIATYHQAQWEKKRLRVAYASRWHVVILNLPKWCTQEFLVKAFRGIGVVQRYLIQRDEDTLTRNFNMGLGYLAFDDRAASKQTFDTKTVAGPDGVHFFKVTSGLENANVIFKCRWTLFDEPPKNGNNNRLPPVADMGAAGLSSLMTRPRSDSNRFSYWTGPPTEDSLTSLIGTGSPSLTSAWDHENVGQLFTNGSSSSTSTPSAAAVAAGLRQKDLLDIDDYMRENPGVRMTDLIGSRITSRFAQTTPPFSLKARPIVKNRECGGLKLGAFDSMTFGKSGASDSICSSSFPTSFADLLPSGGSSGGHLSPSLLASCTSSVPLSLAGFPAEPSATELRHDALFSCLGADLQGRSTRDSSPMENPTIGGLRLSPHSRLDPDEVLHIETPLLTRPDLSLHVGPGVQVYLKLDNMQPTRSFKQRGIGLQCARAVRTAGATHLVSSSGGNAGLAAAYSARRLGARCTVVVPETTPLMMRSLIAAEGAVVDVHGSVWSEANQHAEQLVLQERDNAYLIHPYDHPDVWDGNSTIIDELASQMPTSPPDVIVVSVGGGGLLNGICEGLRRHGWYETAVVAMETVGADCLHQSYREGHIVKLAGISSIAKSLGATNVSKRTWDLLQEGRFSILPTVVTDAEAVSAVEKFADDMGMLVEPACGAALAAVYSGVLSRLHSEGKLGQLRSVLVVVCGGRIVSPELVRQWHDQVMGPTPSPPVFPPFTSTAPSADGDYAASSKSTSPPLQPFFI